MTQASDDVKTFLTQAIDHTTEAKKPTAMKKIARFKGIFKELIRETEETGIEFSIAVCEGRNGELRTTKPTSGSEKYTYHSPCETLEDEIAQFHTHPTTDFERLFHSKSIEMEEEAEDSGMPSSPDWKYAAINSLLPSLVDVIQTCRRPWLTEIECIGNKSGIACYEPNNLVRSISPYEDDERQYPVRICKALAFSDFEKYSGVNGPYDFVNETLRKRPHTYIYNGINWLEKHENNRYEQ